MQETRLDYSQPPDPTPRSIKNTTTLRKITFREQKAQDSTAIKKKLHFKQKIKPNGCSKWTCDKRVSVH